MATAMENKSKTKLVTHNGSFHADDIFAAAALILYLEKNNQEFEIIRTRDPEIIAQGEYVFDVGGIYDEGKNRFDHHQVGGAGGRVPIEGIGIDYASVGLVWKKFGLELCGNPKAVDLIDKRLIAPIDAGDNGFDLITNNYDISPYFIQQAFFAMRPTWREDDLGEDTMFLKCVAIAKEILLREIIQARDAILAEELVITAYQNSKNKKIIILDKHYPFEYTLHNFSEPLFVIYPRESDGSWCARTVRKDPKTFKNRKDFPKSWGGLRDEGLQQISAVPDAIFCHRALFMAVAKTKEGAIKLAEIAVES